MGTAARPTAARRDYGDDIGDGHKDDSLRTIFPGARPPGKKLMWLSVWVMCYGCMVVDVEGSNNLT